MDLFSDINFSLDTDLFSTDDEIDQKTTMYQCSFCDYTSKYNDRVKKHEAARHSIPTMKQFFCGICNKQCFQSSDLKLHEATHFGAMPYECKLCNKRFKRKSSIKSHMGLFHLSHLPKEFIKCPHCDRVFKSETFLKKHIRNKHEDFSLKINIGSNI